MKRNFVIIALITYFILSCNEEKDDIITFRTCNEEVLTDSLTISTKLIGTWNWTERYCPCCKGVKPTVADKDVFTTFKSDSTFLISEDLKIINMGKWELKKNSESFIISISSQGTGDYLNGYITICDNQLLADNSPVDGCENLFVKAN